VSVRSKLVLGLGLLPVASCASDPAVPPTPPPSCADVTSQLRPYSTCGGSADLTPINSYTGDITAVQDREDAVVLIDGTCSGTLVAAAKGPVVLTAGHCASLGQQVEVAFNVEANPDGDTLTTNGTTIEQADDPDYALIRLDQLPHVTPTALTTTPTDRLAIIQHPLGEAKQVAVGDVITNCGPILMYDVDTRAGSSGAGVLTEAGLVVAVHSDGDCSSDGGGANWGSTISAILGVSSYLVAADVTD
jgi:V8-like Glu-specific endopeptidase